VKRKLRVSMLGGALLTVLLITLIWQVKQYQERQSQKEIKGFVDRLLRAAHSFQLTACCGTPMPDLPTLIDENSRQALEMLADFDRARIIPPGTKYAYYVDIVEIRLYDHQRQLICHLDTNPFGMVVASFYHIESQPPGSQGVIFHLPTPALDRHFRSMCPPEHKNEPAVVDNEAGM